ncbi:hypothetical protein I4U23_001414 [Adineta vaga]|nr:hypothetical protein I4U23_001414 [Adineta vaga]
MPVSFIITEGHHFQERLITFGQQDPNEDHHHPGQSVTQQCRSYVFSVSNHTKIRIIDTPGMGDTRGIDQDDDNMQHILSFISNLSHINAVCILLKPNESKLNVVLRSYFTRLLGFLGEKVRENIVFCFTNTRSTFFAPGDTGPLLREMLKSSPIKNIPFEKRNTFCFDSESFRYLIARENDVKFDDYQKQEYEQSWIKSSKESQRLIAYICADMKCYSKDEWKSIEHAQFEINRMVRPMLETIRNTMRNTILFTKKSSDRSILLVPRLTTYSSVVCRTCKRSFQRYSNFWILQDDIHIFSKKCENCKCNRHSHQNINYHLTFEVGDKSNSESIKLLKHDLKQLGQACLTFGYFFDCNCSAARPNDPILSYLNQMIGEENEICEQKGEECLNSILLAKLNQFKEEYEHNNNQSIVDSNSMNLREIYKLIRNITQIDLIQQQMDITKQYHHMRMNKQEKQIS